MLDVRPSSIVFKLTATLCKNFFHGGLIAAFKAHVANAKTVEGEGLA
jgi:hypothetical protein